jgi:23S rRNA (adenine2503-C2)-methyltransferase
MAEYSAMFIENRSLFFQEMFPKSPAYRLKQFEAAFFTPGFRSIEDITTLSKEERSKLSVCPWLSITSAKVLSAKKGDTFKAIMTLHDDKEIETVLMQNARGHWTVCVSSQIGCAMACTFCATGTMGFTRNLTVDEIVDQYRFWAMFLEDRPELPPRITNIVFMGMGEPLANYQNVKNCIESILKHTEIGPTRITVSTVGLIPMLTKILNDETWPPVRLAVSLHSADPKTRSAIMPSSYPQFLDKLVEWTDAYFQKFSTRRRHITFEYVMLSKVNDTAKHAQALIRFARRVGKVRINLIPYNFTGEVYRDSLPADFAQFEEALREAGVLVTKRRTMGDDIAAACGQLVVENGKAKTIARPVSLKQDEQEIK